MKNVSLLIVIFFFTGCFTSYPMNLTKEEYKLLSIEQKVKLKKQQTILDNKVQIKRIEYQKQQAKFLHEKQNREDEKLIRLTKINSEKLVIHINKGNFSNIDDYFIVPFELRKFEVKKINVYNKRTKRIRFYLWVSFQETGLYIGVKPRKNYKNLSSYASMNNNDFFDNLSFKPAVIPYSYKWRKNKKYEVSFTSRYYKAQNLNVQVLLKRY